MSEPPRTILNRLLKGTATDDVVAIRAAWRGLLAQGSWAVPFVCERLRTDVWRDKPVGPSAAYFGVLLALLHELDSATFKEELSRLSRAKLHPLHQRTVDLMGRRLADDVAGMINDRIPVYVAQDVADPDHVFSQLQRWSNTPDLDVSRITRIDVIADKAELEYLGLYRLEYDGIVLTWPQRHPNAFVRWLLRLQGEMVFYHEVGHHSFQHSEGGQVAEQEAEANAYMRKMFRAAHPFLAAFGRVFLRPLIALRKKKLADARKKDALSA